MLGRRFSIFSVIQEEHFLAVGFHDLVRLILRCSKRHGSEANALMMLLATACPRLKWLNALNYQTWSKLWCLSECWMVVEFFSMTKVGGRIRENGIRCVSCQMDSNYSANRAVYFEEFSRIVEEMKGWNIYSCGHKFEKVASDSYRNADSD